MHFRAVAAVLALAASATLGGCGSLLTEGSAAGAGIGAAAVANAFTKNGAVTAGIGLGAQAAAMAGVQYVEKKAHKAEQDAIAGIAGPLAPGAVSTWQIVHGVPLEADEHGEVTVSRIIASAAPSPGAGPLSCKEIVFSVDDQDQVPHRSFYTAAICQDGAAWRWASAEPATERWGALQ